jgi:serine O-acetyltransferase
MNTVSELTKLQHDSAVFCRELRLNSRIKLLLVVDFWPVCYFRIIEHCLRKKSLPYRLLRFLLLPLRPLIQGLSGSRIYQGAEIGGGLFLHHSEGVVIVDTATIGENCTFYTGCCLVHKANGTGQAGPTVADNVRFMIGSKIIGPVSIGSHAVIGANAVVLKDVPAHAVAVGVPARLL